MNAPWPYRIYPWVILHTIVVLSGCSEDDSALKNALETGKITASETEADSYTRPIGSLVVNSGDASTNSTQVNVVIAAEDGIIMGYLLSNSSNTPTLSTAGWVSLVSKDRYNTTLTRTIPASEQSHSYYVWFRDSHGNISDSATDSITYDVTAPAGSVSINSGASSTLSTSVTLNLSATDSAGVVAYYASTSSSTPALQTPGWQSITSTTSYSANISFTLSSGTGTKYAYVWYRDFAGNTSSVVNDGITLVSTETKTGSGSITGGFVYLYFSIPSGTSSVQMTVKLAGDFGSYSEYASVYLNGYYLGKVSSGYDGYTLVTPSGWSSKSISSSYWTAGSTATAKFDATYNVNYDPGGGFYYKYKVTLSYQ